MGELIKLFGISSCLEYSEDFRSAVFKTEEKKFVLKLKIEEVSLKEYLVSNKYALDVLLSICEKSDILELGEFNIQDEEILFNIKAKKIKNEIILELVGVEEIHYTRQGPVFKKFEK